MASVYIVEAKWEGEHGWTPLHMKRKQKNADFYADQLQQQYQRSKFRVREYVPAAATEAGR